MNPNPDVPAPGIRTAGVAIAMLLLSGCTATAATAPSAPPSPRSTLPSYPPSEGPVTVLDTVVGFPPGITEDPLPPAHFPVPLVFTDPDDAGVLWISTRGSSTCPEIPATYSTSPRGPLTISVEPDHERVIPKSKWVLCTDDLALTSTAIKVPEGVDDPTEVVIRETTDTNVPVRPHPEQ